MLELAKKVDLKKLGIFLAIALVLFYIWYRGRKSGQAGQAKHIEVPTDFVTYDAAGNITSQVDGNKIRRIATLMHDEMNNTWGAADHQPFIEFSQLSDTEFTMVYNDFNERYFSEGDGTLKEWIEDDYWFGWDVIDEVIMPKLARLNLN